MIRNKTARVAAALCIAFALVATASAQVAVRGKKVYTMAGPPIEDGVVVIKDGKITAIGPAASTPIPSGYRVLEGKIVTPGLIDGHCTVGLSGLFNSAHDSDQLESSAAIQPELRAIDAYNIRDKLVDWVRSFGVTTVHTGNAPGELVSGQTTIVKTAGNTVEDAMLVETAAVVATMSPDAFRKDKGGTPGTRGKLMAAIRQDLIKAQEYLKKQQSEDEEKRPARDLHLEALGRVLKRELPLMVTANRAQDIATTLRLGREFDIRIWLDGGAESYLLIDNIKAAHVPVFIHPTMHRAWGEYENMSFETASKLVGAGIPVVMQGGYEDYVPKARVVLFEAGWAAANGLTFEQALASITIEAARTLGVDERIGSLEVGKDGDVAIYDGDPFEYTSHCTGVVIQGDVVSDTPR